MDTFIGLGIVIKNHDDIEKDLESFFDFLEVHVPAMKLFYPHEGNYEDWRERMANGDHEDTLEDLANRGAYARFEMTFGDYRFDTNLTLNNEGEDFVIHLMMEDSFATTRSIAELEMLTQAISAWIASLENHVVYDYVFCDNEAQYLYKKARMMELGYNPYAILKLFDRQLVYASWYVDGQTERKLRQ